MTTTNDATNKAVVSTSANVTSVGVNARNVSAGAVIHLTMPTPELAKLVIEVGGKDLAWIEFTRNELAALIGGLNSVHSQLKTPLMK